MKNSKILKTILFVAGAVFMAAGIGTLFFPIEFSAKHGVDLIQNTPTLNDIRGAGGLMLASGIIILLGVIHHRMAFTSTVVTAVMYSVFALSRMLSFQLDGSFTEGLLKATIVEVILGALGIFALIKYRNPTEN